MVNIRDAVVILQGQVIGVEEITDRETQAFAGRKITIMNGEGAAVVKLKPEDRVTVPHVGSGIVWAVRNAPYAVGDNNGMTTRFVREVGETEIAGIAAAVSELSKASKAA